MRRASLEPVLERESYRMSTPGEQVEGVYLIIQANNQQRQSQLATFNVIFIVSVPSAAVAASVRIPLDDLIRIFILPLRVLYDLYVIRLARSE